MVVLVNVTRFLADQALAVDAERGGAAAVRDGEDAAQRAGCRVYHIGLFVAFALHGDAVVLRKPIGMAGRGGSVERVVVGRFLIVQPSFSPFCGSPRIDILSCGAEMRLRAHFSLDS